MKRISLVAIFLLVSLVFCRAEQEAIVLITSADNPPYEFTKTGEIVGFDIDLAKIIAEKLDRRLIIKDMPFASIVQSLILRHGDFSLASITPTDAKRMNIDFSIPYQNNMSAIVLADRYEFPNMEPDAIFPLALLEGKTIGVQLGTHHESDIRVSEIPSLTIRRYDNVNVMVAEISKATNGYGSLYGVVVGTAEAKMILKKSPSMCMFPLQFSDYFAVALPKNSQLKNDIDKIIEELKESGQIEELEAKWDINR